jgi:O-antigen/teichoic acid export membrane protein
MLGKSVENLLLKSREFLSHPGVRRYGSNTAWMFAEQILRMVAGFLVGVWVARYLGPEKFGLFSYALAFVAIFQGIAKLGLDGILVRDLVREPEKATVYLGTAFWLKLFGAVITLLFIGLAIQFTGNDATTNLYILIIASGLIFQSFEVIDFYFQSKVLAKYVSICKMVQLALSSLIKIFLILIGADLIWFVMVSLIDMITLAITLNIAYKYNKNPSFYKYFDINLGKRLLKDSWPLILTSFFTLVILNFNRIIINSILTNIEVGLFTAAYNVLSVFLTFTVIITTSISPAITSAKKQNELIYKNRLERLISLLFILALMFSLILFLFSDYIIYLLYGKDYEKSSLVLKVLAWALPFIYMGNSSWLWYLNENKQKYSIYRLLSGVFVLIISGYLFTSKFGLVGISISTILTYIVSFFLGNVFSKETRELFVIQLRSIIFINIWRLLNEKKYNSSR